MKDKNNILLISEDEQFLKVLASKLLFLRCNDKVVSSNYSEAFTSVDLYMPIVVLVHGTDRDETYDLIKDLRKDKSLCIILVSDSYKPEFILAAYDCGADDFILSSADDFEFVLRIVHNMKHNSVKYLNFRNVRMLEQLGVMDENSGVYNYSSSKQVIENYIDDYLLEKGCFMALSASEKSKANFDVEKLALNVKSIVRVDDVVTYGKGSKVYVLLPNADLNQALVVFNKVKVSCLDEFEICAGISSISDKNFEQIESDALNSLSTALATGMEYSFAQDEQETLDEWLDDDELKKGYKIFRQIFNKKMEKVIAPVFYRLQKTYEDKLFDTEIEQYTDQNQCVFKLINKKQESVLKIVYPGFAKIVISVTHEGLDSPENTEIQIPLTKITQRELVKIVEDFIKDFKKSIL